MSTPLTVVLVAAALVVGALVGLAASGGLSGTRKPNAAPTTAAPTTAAPTTATTGLPTTTTTSRAEAAAQLLSAVHVVPADGATHQSPSTVVSVTAPASARLLNVRVRPAAGGAAIAGALDAKSDEWTATGHLLPGVAYLVSYAVQGTGGLVAYGSANFTTAPPTVVVSAESLFPSSGIVVGVGQPIVIYFSHPVDTYAAQQAVLSHLHLAMSKPVPGGWHWFSSVELHFRPAHYWPVGDQVQLTGDLTGWDVGGGAWGEGQLFTSFVVGASHISVVNVAAHEMTVYDNGRAIYTWPISAGAPNWPTQDGVHIVLDRDSEVHMISSSVGIPVGSPGGYNEEVYWDVHISSSGEYVHAAPWSLSEQGYVNVSHGCVNLSPQRAETFFRFSRAGDVVDVVNSSRAPVMGDQGVMDWSFPSSAVIWTPAKVSPLTSTVSTSTTTTEPAPVGAPYYPTTLPPAAPAP